MDHLVLKSIIKGEHAVAIQEILDNNKFHRLTLEEVLNSIHFLKDELHWIKQATQVGIEPDDRLAKYYTINEKRSHIRRLINL